MDDLDPVAIHRRLAAAGARLGAPLTLVPVTASTNDDARAAARAGAPHGATFVADAQSKGRGQGAHTWHSPAGRNLYLSVVIRPRPGLGAADVAPVTLVAGVAVVRAVAPYLPEPSRVGLKWPNDLWIGGRKAAGILVEAGQRGADLTHLVVGIGINVLAQAFPPELDARATCLAHEGATVDRSTLLASVLGELDAAYASFDEGGLAAHLDAIRAADALRGRDVRVSLPDGSVETGRAVGIDDAGRLLVDVGGARRCITSGRVELRPA